MKSKYARKLFYDNKLLGNLNALMNVFLPYNDLERVTSEKGTFTPTSTGFNPDSIFGFVEKEFAGKTDYLICDDLGNEWADHIGLKKDAIMFFHSKYGETGLSASQFQDINGQAQKNLGNIIPADHQWNGKLISWKNTFKIKKVTTKIHRIRKGKNANAAIEYYKDLIKDPYVKKQVYLVINFLSKLDFKNRLTNLRDGLPVNKKNEVIQLLGLSLH